MKRILFLMIGSVLALSSFAQNGIKIRYAWKTYFISPQNGILSEDKKSASISNDDIEVTVSPVKLSGAGFDSFDIEVKNKTDKKLTILIDESNYIADGEALPLVDSKTLIINLENAETRWNIPPHSKSKKELCQKFRREIDRTNLAGAKDVSIFLSYKLSGIETSKDLSFNFKILKKKK